MIYMTKTTDIKTVTWDIFCKIKEEEELESEYVS